MKTLTQIDLCICKIFVHVTVTNKNMIKLLIVVSVTLPDYPNVVSHSVIASAGRHQTCLPSWRKESSARVYARYASSAILWGLKDKTFLGHFWLGIFIQDNLPVNLKQEV